MKKILSFAISIILICCMLLPLVPSAVALGDPAVKEELSKISDYRTKVYNSPEEKLETMTPVAENDNFILYVQEVTAEVAVQDKKTGQILFTNPYDIAEANASDVIKFQLLSQIILEFRDNEGVVKTFESYDDCVTNDQVRIKQIRNGVRVEYTIGQSTKKRIVPRQISKESFEEKILRPFYEKTTTGSLDFDEYIAYKFSQDFDEQLEAQNCESFEFGQFLSFYSLFDAADPNITAREQSVMLENYPITEKFPIYVISDKTQSSDKQVSTLEDYIKEYTEYSLDDMITDHEQVGYELETQSPAVFNMALEYTIDEEGMQARLPSRGLSFDTESYTLNYLSILPYVGAGRSGAKDGSRYDDGYNFVPDGSGAIIKFNQNSARTQVSGTIYGNDFGFYNATSSATANYQTWRVPVYGTVMNTHYNYDEPILDENGEKILDAEGNEVTKHTEKDVSQGYVAIITEGESLTRVDSVNGGSQHDYNSVYTTLFPRQTDSYPLDGITVSGGSAVYTKEIERRYVGNYTIKYKLLWGDDASYVGMANAYRDYLIKKGDLEKLSDDSKDIPLFLDLLGDIDVAKKVLGIPVQVKKELTTFENAKTIITELKAENINNQVIRYEGWMNGGMKYTAASKLKVEKILGGEKGLKDLISFANNEKIKVFMDIDFAHVKDASMFDGYDEDKDAVKTIDGKTAYYRIYSPVTQSYHSRIAKITSPNSYSDFYGNITAKYSSYFADYEKNISLGTIGDVLNSSQDEDNPLNRENSKDYTRSFIEDVDADYDNVMTNKGNAYVWGGVNYMTEVALDSSNRNNTSEEVPFLGIVLHGYMNFSGEALNLAGDYEYTVLKTIENGASPYFMLAYQNSAELKTNGYSRYYAVDYSTWKENIIEEYNKINSALSSVQHETIKNHEFLGNRIVKVTYSNDTVIYLNYNNFEAEAEGHDLNAMDFVVVNN